MKARRIYTTIPVLSQENVLVDICPEDNDRYRFGFNGKEKINEWSGIGNFMDYGARGHDSRVGRWQSTDPLGAKYPNESRYIFAGNSPLAYNDQGGNVKTIITFTYNQQTAKTTIQVQQAAGLKGVHRWAYNGLDSWDWYDYTVLNTIVITKDGKTVTSTSGPVITDYTNIRTNTLANWEWWAKEKINDFDNDRVKDKSRALNGFKFEGYLLTSRNGSHWIGRDSKFNADGSSSSQIVNVDAILSAFNNSGYASGTNGLNKLIGLEDSRFINDFLQIANELQSNTAATLDKKKADVVYDVHQQNYYEYKRDSDGNTMRKAVNKKEGERRAEGKEVDSVDIFGTKYNRK